MIVNGEIKLHPFNEAMILPGNKEYLEPLLASYNERRADTTDEQRSALIAAAYAGDRESVVALGAAREERIRLNIWADNIALSLFELIELGPDEWIELVNMSDQVFSISETHLHGEAPIQSWLQANTTEMRIPFKISTGIIKYPIIHGVTGNVLAAQDVDIDAARAMDQQINTEIYTLLDANWGSYPVGSAVVDARIVAGTRPTSSDLDDTSEASFTHTVFKDVVDHFLRLGKSLRMIVINPTEIRDTWDWQHLVSTTASGSQDGRTMITTRVKDEILQSGFPGSMYGQTFTWMLDPIRPLKFADCYSTEPAGTFYDKPSLAKAKQYDEDAMEARGLGENFNGIKNERWIKTLIKNPQFYNALRVQFVT